MILIWEKAQAGETRYKGFRRFRVLHELTGREIAGFDIIYYMCIIYICMSRCQFAAVYPPMLNHIRMGKLAGWRPRGHHERVRESHIMNFVYYKRWDRDLPYRLSAGRKKEVAWPGVS